MNTIIQQAFTNEIRNIGLDHNPQSTMLQRISYMEYGLPPPGRVKPRRDGKMAKKQVHTMAKAEKVGGTCGSVHVESFNKNMKALGVLESQWDPIRKKLVRRLLEEQDKVLRSYFTQKGGARSQGGEGIHGKGREHVKWDMYA
jgi:hypothetical protein